MNIPAYLLHIEELLNSANKHLLDFADEIGRKQWAAREHEAVMRALAISKELTDVVNLLFEVDGAPQRARPSSTVQ